MTPIQEYQVAMDKAFADYERGVNEAFERFEKDVKESINRTFDPWVYGCAIVSGVSFLLFGLMRLLG